MVGADVVGADVVGSDSVGQDSLSGIVCAGVRAGAAMSAAGVLAKRTVRVPVGMGVRVGVRACVEARFRFGLEVTVRLVAQAWSRSKALVSPPIVCRTNCGWATE